MPIPVDRQFITDVLQELAQGTTPVYVDRAKVETAIKYYVQVMCYDEPDDPQSNNAYAERVANVASHVYAIDLRKPVKPVDLDINVELIGYRYNLQSRFAELNPYGDYFTLPGTPKGNVGVCTDHRRFIKYVVRKRTSALMATARSGYVRLPRLRSDPTRYPTLVHGGAIQYVIPQSFHVLRVAHIQNVIR